jgi:DNA-binding PadR family transcriptional regulator
MLNKMVEDNLIRKREDGRYEPVKDEYEETNSFGQWSQGKYTVESAVKEMDSYISYLEDLPREKVKPFEDQIARINDRLQKLKESL